MKSFLGWLAVMLLTAVTAIAQLRPVTLPLPTNLAATYQTGTRSMTGSPGKNYWQNRAAYKLQISFDPATRLLTGTANIVYTNNSPDTLTEILFKLYPNLYKKGSPRLMRIADQDAGEGLRIEKMSADGKAIDTDQYRTDGTNMTVRCGNLLPGGRKNFDITYSYTLNEGSHIRTGQVAAGANFLAYFFPRIAVYDDIDGWNRHPYLGTQEFYNDFCDFKLAVTVPGNYMVWATGDLKNCSEVYTEKYCNRISTAEREDRVANIIDTTDLKAGGITQPNASNTWQFEATNVTDVAVAFSNHYVWQSSSLVVDKTSGRRSRVDAVFNPVHKDYYWVVGDARKTVEGMSFYFPKWPYPYNHETVFDGLDQMEYPMMVNDNPVEDRAESMELTDHEIFHTMFPFYMGTNETKYGWMDEGWATIGEWLITRYIDSSIVDEYGMDAVNRMAGTEADLPITTLTTQQFGTSMFINSYPKPALGYLYAKDILGDEKFYKGLHHYIREWNGKHPMPYDFFNCMNTGSGQNLNWFWKRWFFEGGVPDLSISKVTGAQLTITCKGEKPVPIDLTVTYADGSNQLIHRSAAVWQTGNKTVNISCKPGRKIIKLQLGSTYIPDVNKADNVYETK